ncbi:MAG: cytidine deaminase [Planctomycetes bacterium]|nr:cytidine deaminase [Planctomycetota bacterium]
MADAKRSGGGSDDEIHDLLRVAHAAAVLAHSPYSKIQVGAALVASNGEIYTGCNVENASFGLTLCAERAAVAKAVSSGATSFRAIAIASTERHPLMPCGACRQVLREFATDMRIHVQGKEGPRVDTTLAELLPRAFGPADVH